MGVLNTASTLGPGAFITTEPARVIAMPIERFPGMWQALDMVDAIYWDDPAPDELDVEQQRALAQWVWRGGQLVVGLGVKSQGLMGSTSELAKLLPVSILSDSQRADLHPLGRALLGYQYGNQFSDAAPSCA